MAEPILIFKYWQWRLIANRHWLITYMEVCITDGHHRAVPLQRGGGVRPSGRGKFMGVARIS